MLPVGDPAPPAAGPDPADRHAAHPGRPPPRAPDPGAPGPDSLPETDRIRLGVAADWKHGPHLLTYRQVERTFHLAVTALAKDQPDGAPSPAWPASSTRCWKPASRAGHKDRPARWPSTGATWKPSPARRPAAAATAPTPKPPGDTAAATSHGQKGRALLRLLPGAPRGAVQPNGGERPLSSGRRSGLSEAEGSLIRGTPGRARAALTKPGRASTARWRGSGKQGRKVQRKRTSG